MRPSQSGWRQYLSPSWARITDDLQSESALLLLASEDIILNNDNKLLSRMAVSSTKLNNNNAERYFLSHDVTYTVRLSITRFISPLLCPKFPSMKSQIF